MLRAGFIGGTCSEPINLEVFVPHKRSGGEACEDERELRDKKDLSRTDHFIRKYLFRKVFLFWLDKVPPLLGVE